MKFIVVLISLLLTCLINPTSAKSYMSQKEFLALAFANQSTHSKPEMKTLWLSSDIQQKITPILEHKYPKLRIRYWQQMNQTVWFLDEIGKERPISFAVSIIENEVKLIKVLTFRESRGYEIQMQAFTDQFNHVELNKENQLSRHIDGITGATMSVSAMKKITRVALVLAKLVNQ